MTNKICHFILKTNHICQFEVYEMEQRFRTAVYFPVKIKEMLDNLSKATGKSVNSIVIDSCLEYLAEFKEKYDFLLDEDQDNQDNTKQK